ncbi:hypothetical protein [Glycomyces paridis]|uniref:CdiI C-terminal domain-containing protein n=1 Tax=Glycomyces paridis TaxID=2126555 RepID=A0A4S8PML1_9ACTN|nr:hypothetical protein [Glycomyces paridis]THV32113.1 hypothetical protein E9998_01270 [Glycomyces paridis]
MLTITASTLDAAANGYFTGCLRFPDGEVEYFRSSLGHWSVERYAASWRAQFAALRRGASVAVLFTGVEDPRSANFVTGWVVYRPGDGFLYLQERLFLDSQLPVGWELRDLGRTVGERTTVTEDGHAVAEWRVRLADIDPQRTVVVTGGVI